MANEIAKNDADISNAEDGVFLTLTVRGQLCGVPVLQIRAVLIPEAITKIPLAPREVAGSLNLRGRIVTAVDLRRRLGLPDREAGSPPPMSVVVEQGTELYSLLSDAVGEVIQLNPRDIEANPPTLDQTWRAVSRGIYRSEGKLMVVLDVERVLAIG